MAFLFFQGLAVALAGGLSGTAGLPGVDVRRGEAVDRAVRAGHELAVDEKAGGAVLAMAGGGTKALLATMVVVIERGGVLQDQQRGALVPGPQPLQHGGAVGGKDRPAVDLGLVEEPVAGLGAGPVAAGGGDRGGGITDEVGSHAHEASRAAGVTAIQGCEFGFGPREGGLQVGRVEVG